MTPRRLSLLACSAMLLAAGCGGDEEQRSAGTAKTVAEPAPPTATTKAPAPAKRERPRPVVDRRKAAVQVAVAELIEAFELSEEQRICELLGQPGAEAEACASRAGVDLLLLPGSEELSFDRTRVEGHAGTVDLAGGTVVSLRRSRGRWAVTGVRRE